jgi:hypothetical protein
MFSSDTLARLRAHRSTIARYRKLLESPLTDLERGFIELRLNEEKEAAEALFPFPLSSSHGPAQEGCHV